jgi:hypothetical protein
VSADLLRRAAALLRERGTAATPGPWAGVRGSPPRAWVLRPGGTGIVERQYSGTLADIDFIALMHPPVALALADLLDATGEFAESNDQSDGFDLSAVDPTFGPAVALAHAILREEP